MSDFSRRKLRYSILKELDRGRSITHEKFGITSPEFIAMLHEMQKDDYITGITFTKTHTTGTPRPTPLGEQYTDENSGLAKSYKLAKEIRDWIKP